MHTFLDYLDFDFSSPSAIVQCVIGGIIALLLLVSEWRVLEKAGEKGWKTLIPFYNIYISHHVMGMAHIWFILEIIVWPIELLLEILDPVPDWLEIGFGIPTAIITIISMIVHANCMGKCFGKSRLYRLGLLLLPEVCLPMIAFGKSKYIKPEQH